MNYKQLLTIRLLKDPNLDDYNEIVEGTTTLLSFDQQVQWASKCARSVLYIFEKTYPEDIRVRECLDFLDRVDWENPTDEQLRDLRRLSAAARAAANAAAYAADASTDARTAYANDDVNARSAGAAARASGYAAHASGYAAARASGYTGINAARLSVDAYTARATTNATNASAKKDQQKKNLQFLLEILINGK